MSMAGEYAQLRKEVISALDLRLYYESHTGQQVAVDSDGWSQKLKCCLHDDTRPSLSVNIVTGGFKCFACDKTGSIFDFHNWKHGRDPRDKVNFKWAFVELAGIANVDIGTLTKQIQEKTSGEPPAPEDCQAARKVDKPVVVSNKADSKDQNEQPLKMAVIKRFNESLVEDHYAYLSQKRGLTISTINEFLIGWDPNGFVEDCDGNKHKGRYTIPVFCKAGLVRNVRKYSPESKPEQKMMNTKGYGSPVRLFMLHKLLSENWENVVVCEGEFDCILLNQIFKELRLNTWGAVTGTHGCNTWEAEWLEYFYDRHVYFCYDADSVGEAAVTNICTKHFLSPIKQKKFKSVRIIKLPLEGSKEYKDITDLFVKLKYKPEEFLSLCIRTPSLEAGGISSDEATVAPIDVANFASCVRDRQFIDKRVRVPLAISGQTSNLYHAIREFSVGRCPAMDKCCSTNAGDRLIPYGHDIFIAACGASKSRITAAIQSIACTMDQKCSITITKKVVMEEYFAHQVIDRWIVRENEETGRMENTQDVTLTTIPVYILQPEASISIKPQNYTATGWVRSHPNTHQATLFVEHLEPLEDEWSKFEVNAASIKNLKALAEHSVGVKLRQITSHVTKIYDSDEILMSVLLSYLSPLWFCFDHEVIRGWLNVCIMGDSGTGKSMTYGRIADWIGVGDSFSVLTGTRTGLLYAVKQKNDEWYVHVGKYVTSSGEIIAIDEAQEAEASEIKLMAIAMDTGKLDVNQVAQASYTTNTRTVFLMNPKHGKKISDFPYGCLALPECFDQMFIRRLDLAVLCTSKDKLELYNQRHKPNEPVIITADMFRTLVYWAWTRKADDIKWSEEATDLCLEQSKVLSEKYGHTDDIPLVDPQGFRKKLARLSVAYSILSCSFTSDYRGSAVSEKHVKTMSVFLDAVYSSSSCNLLQHAKLSKKKRSLQDYEKIKENFEAVIRNARFSENRQYAESNAFCQLLILLQQSSAEFGVRPRDLKDQIGVSLRWIQRHIAIMHSYNLVEVVRSSYKTTRKFNLFMQKWQLEEGVEGMLDGTYQQIGKQALMSDDSAEFYGTSQSQDKDDDLDRFLK